MLLPAIEILHLRSLLLHNYDCIKFTWEEYPIESIDDMTQTQTQMQTQTRTS
jgi:hypothetical protein